MRDHRPRTYKDRAHSLSSFDSPTVSALVAKTKQRGGATDLHVESLMLMRDGIGERTGSSLGSASLGARVGSSPPKKARLGLRGQRAAGSGVR